MNKRLLSVLAHPDDESFGPGGTFARYAAEGVDVHVAIATDGVAGSVADGYEEALQELVAVRSRELEAAARILGVTLHKFCYRDSGYINDPANNHPEAFINTDEREAIGKVVRLIRELQPQVVVTHDETGGYFHPDHIHCWKITTAAFHAAADPNQYPEIGPAPFQPERLYYTAFSNSMVKFYTAVLRLRGKDPTAQGKNKDIDFTRLGIPPHKIHARIDWRDYWDVKLEASAQHASQGGGTSQSRLLPVWLAKRFLAKDSFIRAYPAVPDGFKEKNLFPEP
jgi:LmbE family N-acetylglucosaminyl deacetylase